MAAFFACPRATTHRTHKACQARQYSAGLSRVFAYATKYKLNSFLLMQYTKWRSIRLAAAFRRRYFKVCLVLLHGFVYNFALRAMVGGLGPAVCQASGYAAGASSFVWWWNYVSALPGVRVMAWNVLD